MGIKGKNSIIKTTKIIESTAARMKTEGIIITSAAAMMTNAKYAAIYPPRPVTCLPFMVIVVPAKKWITDVSSNMPITINSIFFFFIVIISLYISKCPDFEKRSRSGELTYRSKLNVFASSAVAVLRCSSGLSVGPRRATWAGRVRRRSSYRAFGARLRSSAIR